MYKIPTDTLFFGKNLLILPECPSTNTLAGELAQAGKAPEGTVVITHNQTSGRGQRGNTWESTGGLNLTFSVVVYPVFLDAVQQFHLNKAVAVAIHDVVSRHTQESVCVKWPNDIMISGKKVCGILIENQLSGNRLGRSIIGIGLNVNQREFNSPVASSVSIHSGKSMDLPKIFDDLLQSLEWRYLQLKSNHMKELEGDYIRSLFWLNESKPFMVGDKRIEGKILGVDESGRLIVEIEEPLQSSKPDSPSRGAPAGQGAGATTRSVFDFKEIKYLL